MKVLCKGFNLYHQLDYLNSSAMEDFIETFRDTSFENLQINHTYSLLKKQNMLIFYSSAFREIYNLSFIDLSTIISDDANICKISSDDEKILLLSDTGQLYKLPVDNAYIVQSVSKFWDSDDKLEGIVSGPKLNVAYSRKGCLFNIPNKLDIKINVADIKLGKEHCVILDKSGNVYTFGRGSRGQLGHGNLNDLSEPQLVQALAGIKILKIAAGGWHSCAVSIFGDLYTWGLNVNGQLGLGNENSVSVMATPHVIDFKEDQNIMDVACGNHHTIALLDEGILYGCGWNKYKQLYNDETESYGSFKKIHNFSKETIVDLICGPWNTCVLCKETK